MKFFSAISVTLLAIGLGFLLGRGHGSRSADAMASRRVLYWIDPMHPAYRSDHPGTAPDCGMQLEPVYADSLTSASVVKSLDMVAFSDSQLEKQALSMAAVRVERTAGSEYLRLPGRVVADQTRIYKVNAGVDGFVKKTHEDTVGSFVKKNQRLAVIYSPEFLTVFGGYLSASERTQNTALKDGVAASQGIAGVQNWADRLRNLGVGDAQIAEVNESRKIPEDIYVLSPVNGFILSRNIAANGRFERHTEFYRIADLSHLWIIADVPVEEATYIHPGMVVNLIGPNLKSSFSARVSNVLPEVDPASRILKLRVEVDNPRFSVRPEMLVTLEIQARAPAGLSVPRDAVIDSGLEQRVFVQAAKGIFEPRTVKTGSRFKDRVEIVRGLSEGEWVASKASFAIDSEARLQTAAPPLGSRVEEGDQTAKTRIRRRSAPRVANNPSAPSIADNKDGCRPNSENSSNAKKLSQVAALDSRLKTCEQNSIQEHQPGFSPSGGRP